MSTILLEDLKRYLKPTHDLDDELLQDALNAAEKEALNFMDRDFLPVEPTEELSESESELNPVSDGETPSEASAEVCADVRMAVFLLAKSHYDGTQPDAFRGLLDLSEYRKRAEGLLMPYRRHLGV